ncbi:MAG: helix-turn-helix domain-containing protein [Cocleimonas sp.]|nr:helix-turn-helix domain-containing protein [Cocleimonas sp.]
MSANKESNSPIGKRLRSARISKGLSQKQLGILAEIDEFSASPRINQYERDKHVPDFSTAKRLAKTLDIPVTYLYADDDDLADLILLFSSAGSSEQDQALSILKASK